MFKNNIGPFDRGLRVLVGAVLLAWFFVDQTGGTWHYAKLIGIIPLITGLIGSCPIYSLFGMNTCTVK